MPQRQSAHMLHIGGCSADGILTDCFGSLNDVVFEFNILVNMIPLHISYFGSFCVSNVMFVSNSIASTSIGKRFFQLSFRSLFISQAVMHHSFAFLLSTLSRIVHLVTIQHLMGKKRFKLRFRTSVFFPSQTCFFSFFHVYVDVLVTIFHG